jgi:hypothetical protein
MKYLNSSTFRRALDERLIHLSLQNGLSLARLRRLAACDRFLARLIQSQPGQWALTGGYVLQLRMGESGHAMQNIDMVLVSEAQPVFPALQKAADLDLNDWFCFEVLQADRQTPGVFGRVRYPIECVLDNRPFENFHLEVGAFYPLANCLEDVYTSSLLAFADIQPACVPCYPIVQQLAEKLYAYTLPRVPKEHSRVKDFVDIYLLAGLADLEGATLLQTLQATFTFAQTHPLPARLPPPRRDWPPVFEKMANELGLKETQLDQAFTSVQQFFDPLLEGRAAELRWDPKSWTWK